MDSPIKNQTGGVKMELDNKVKIAYGRLILAVFNRKAADDLLPLLNPEIELIDWALASLKPREQEVLKQRFGLASGVGVTLKQLGSKLGVGRERARQLERKALVHLSYPNRLGKFIFFYSSLRQRLEDLTEENEKLQARLAHCESALKAMAGDGFRPDLIKEQAISDQPILGLRIDENELSVRLHNLLNKMGIEVIYDLVVKSEAELSLIRGLGSGSLAEVKEFLADRGLSLGMKF